MTVNNSQSLVVETIEGYLKRSENTTLVEIRSGLSSLFINQQILGLSIEYNLYSFSCLPYKTIKSLDSKSEREALAQILKCPSLRNLKIGRDINLIDMDESTKEDIAMKLRAGDGSEEMFNSLSCRSSHWICL